MSSSRPAYPPLSARHKRIFLAAAALAIAYVVSLSLARLALIYWWLASCDEASTACAWADFGFTWWWVALILGVLAIALGAHRLTADRLVVE